MGWVPSTKVHARFVFVKKIFHTDKTMENRKSDRSSGDYGTRKVAFYVKSLSVSKRPSSNARRTNINIQNIQHLQYQHRSLTIIPAPYMCISIT